MSPSYPESRGSGLCFTKPSTIQSQCYLQWSHDCIPIVADSASSICADRSHKVVSTSQRGICSMPRSATLQQDCVVNASIVVHCSRSAAKSENCDGRIFDVPTQFTSVLRDRGFGLESSSQVSLAQTQNGSAVTDEPQRWVRLFAATLLPLSG